MFLKTLMAAAVAAAFAFPVHAGGDKAASGASSDAKAGASKSDGGEAMFKDLDKNKDGFISKEEAKGSPHEKEFSKLDKDSDGKLSKDEHGAAHKDQSASGATSGSSDKSGSASSGGASQSQSQPAGSSKKY